MDQAVSTLKIVREAVHLAKCLKKYSANKFCFSLACNSPWPVELPTQKGPLPLRFPRWNIWGVGRTLTWAVHGEKQKREPFDCLVASLLHFCLQSCSGLALPGLHTVVRFPCPGTPALLIVFLSGPKALSLGQGLAELGQLSWQAVVWNSLIPIPYPHPRNGPEGPF